MLKATKQAQLTGHNAAIYSVIGGPTEKEILSGGGEGWVVSWKLDEPDMGQLVAKVETQIFSMCLLQSKDRMVVGNMNGGIHWIDLREAQNNQNIAHHKKGCFALVQVGKHLFSAGGDGLLTRWDIEKARSIESLQLSHMPLRSLAFSPERNELAVGSSDHNIYLLDASTLSVKYTFEKAHENSVFSLHFSPDQKLLLSGGRDAHLKVWALDEAYQNLSSQAAHWFTINDIAFHPDGKYFATASRDKTIRIWDSHDFSLLKAIEVVRDQGHINSVNALYWSEYNNYLISASDDRRLIVWDV